MADITVTAANVRASSGQENLRVGTAGATITAGQSIYVDTADANKIKLADANASAATAILGGVAMTNAASGQPVVYVTGGTYVAGATVVKGTVYILSANAGGIAPAADAAAGWYVSVLGVGASTTEIAIDISNTGILV